MLIYTIFSLQEYVFVGQYAAAITCLDDMWRVKIAGLSEANKIEQARLFCREIQNILNQKLIEYAHFCEIVSYDGGFHRYIYCLHFISLKIQRIKLLI